MIRDVPAGIRHARMARVRVGVHVVSAVLACALLACRDTPGIDGTAPTPSVQRTAKLTVEAASAGDSVITVTLRVSRLPAQRVGSATAAVVYDSTRLRFLNDASPADGGVRAAHARDGRLMIAVAHALGFDDETMARVRFVARDTAAHHTLQLQMRELHLLDATDARLTLTTLPLEVIR